MNPNTNKKHLQLYRKYIILTNKYRDAYSHKLSKEDIYELSFKYEFALISALIHFELSFNKISPFTCSLARKLIESYGLYLLKDDSYFTDSNYELFKICADKNTYGFKDFDKLSQNLKLSTTIIKKRMYDNDFPFNIFNLKSFEDLFSNNEIFNDQEQLIFISAYRALGYYTHYSFNDFEIRGLSKNILEIIDFSLKIGRKILKEDFDQIKRIDSINIFESSQYSKISNINERLLNKISETQKTFLNHDIDLKNEFLLFKGVFRSLFRMIFYYNEFYKGAFILYVKPFIEYLAFYFNSLNNKSNYSYNELIETLDDAFNLNYKIFIFNEENRPKEESQSIIKYIFNLKKFKELDIEEKKKKGKELSKISQNPLLILDDKNISFKKFVNRFILNIGANTKLSFIYNESLKATHSYGQLSTHEFNYKQALAVILETVDSYITYLTEILRTKYVDSLKDRSIKFKLSDTLNDFLDIKNESLNSYRLLFEITEEYINKEVWMN